MFWLLLSTSDLIDKNGIILLSIKEQDKGERFYKQCKRFMERTSRRFEDLGIPDVETPSDLVVAWKAT